MTKMDQILSTTNAPKFRQQQQNGLNFLSTTHAPKFPQQQQNGPNALNNKLHQNFLNNNIKMDKILSTTNAPKIPQQQQNGPISLNNKCTQFFQQQTAYSALLSHSWSCNIFLSGFYIIELFITLWISGKEEKTPMHARPIFQTSSSLCYHLLGLVFFSS
jgi:hypothetical protein